MVHLLWGFDGPACWAVRLTTIKRHLEPLACQHGGMRVGEATRLRQPEAENARLKKLLAEAEPELIAWMRTECFATLLEAQVVTESWRIEYNTYRPHLCATRAPRSPPAGWRWLTRRACW